MRLVGRKAVLTQLCRVVDGSDPAVAVVLRGDAGIGKTTVLEALVEMMPAGIRVHQDAARELQQDVPFALVADVFELRHNASDPLRASLGRLLLDDDEAGARAASDPYAKVLRMTEGIVDLLMTEAAESVSALVVDDLHWADRPSLQVLDRILRRAPEVGLRAVLATRPSPRADARAVLDRVASAGGVQIDLEPLAGDDVVQMLSDVVGANPGPHLRTLVRGAAGNPLFVAELGRAVIDAGRLMRSSESVDLPGPEAPSSFQVAIRRRVESLPGPTPLRCTASRS